MQQSDRLHCAQLKFSDEINVQIACRVCILRGILAAKPSEDNSQLDLVRSFIVQITLGYELYTEISNIVKTKLFHKYE